MAYNTICKNLDQLNVGLKNSYVDAAVSSALKTVSLVTYHEYKVALERLANNTKDADATAVYALLADVCSMRLSVKDRSVQYAPFYEFVDERSFDLNCVKGGVCDLLAAIVPHISNPMLKARVADVVALRKKGDSGKEFAEIALDTYFTLPIYEPKTWRTCRSRMWKRAISLATSKDNEAYGKLLIGKFRIDTLHEIENSDAKDPDKILDIAELLVNCKLYEDNDIDKIADALVRAYNDFEGESAYLGRDACAKLMLTMYRKTNNQEKINSSIVMRGDSWMKDGKYWLDKGDKVMAAFRFEEAEKSYLKLSKADRAALSLDSKINECIARKREGFACWVKNIEKIPGQKISIKDEIAQVREHMNVSEPIDRFKRFLLIYRFSECHLSPFKSTSSIDAIFGDSSFRQLSDDGRTEFSGTLGEDRNAESKAAAFWLSYCVATRIVPAYDEIKKLGISQFEFYEIAESITPILTKRKHTIALAWWLGYSGEWRLSSTILIPQIEYLVAKVLESHGCNIVYTQQGSLTETFITLSSLLDKRESTGILGADLHKEMTLLFGGAPYMNMRNKSMHGLIDDPKKGCYYPIDMYIWWFSMRLMLFEPVFMESKGTENQ